MLEINQYCIALPSIVLPPGIMHCFVLHCIVLCYVVLHCITLCCIALQSRVSVETIDILIIADSRTFARKDRNLHCDVHISVENKHTFPQFGSLDSFRIMRSQQSRRRNKGLLHCIVLREKLTSGWEERLDDFQKLLVLRCLRSDKMTNGMQDFVANHLGQRFIEPQVR